MLSSLILHVEASLMNDHLYNARTEGYFLGTAINVFENEPNTGKLVEKDPLLLKAHMGSMSIDCRSQM
jgi:D-3-phosphoglycerate dehydrogenase